MTPRNVIGGAVGAARAESLSSVPFTAVSLEDSFWLERLETVLTRTIPSQYVKLDEHGIFESLRLPQPPPPLRIPVRSQPAPADRSRAGPADLHSLFPVGQS